MVTEKKRRGTLQDSGGRQATPNKSTHVLPINLISRRTFGFVLGCCGFFTVFSVMSHINGIAIEPRHLLSQIDGVAIEPRRLLSQIDEITTEPSRQLLPRAVAIGLPFTTFWKLLRERRNTVVPFCSGMMKNEETDINSALKYMTNNTKEYLPTENFARVKKTDCEVFRQASGYAHRPLSVKEVKFPLAYSIQMYKDVEQVERLLRAIYMPQNYYCIHVDQKSPEVVHKAMGNIAECFPNVFIATRLVDVRWGMFSMLQADLNCMKDLLRYTDWRYFINLTGQEFPLVSNSQLVDNLKELNNTNLIHSWRETHPEFIQRTKYSWKNSTRPTNIKKEEPPFNMNLTKGSLHNFLTRDFVHYVINDAVPHQFLKWLEDTWGPEETFFSSLQDNRHLRAPSCHPAFPRGPIKFDFRYVKWIKDGKNVCAGKWVRGVCVAGVGDLHKAVESKGLFINKLHLNFQPLALDCLEDYQRNLTMRTAEQV